jgi:hypothetical protein
MRGHESKISTQVSGLRPEQFHYVQLQTARQRKDESPRDFAHRVRELVLRTVPKVQDPQLEKFHYDQAKRMLLSTYIAGLIGNPGQQAHFGMPRNFDEAVRIAVTLYESEKRERSNQAFLSHTSYDSESRNVVLPVNKQGSTQ